MGIPYGAALFLIAAIRIIFSCELHPAWTIFKLNPLRDKLVLELAGVPVE